jgi:hypothetical protein
MSGPKITEALAEKLRRCPAAAPIDVAVEMCPLDPPPSSASRSERIHAIRESFEAAVAPVADAVTALGGTVTATVWLNQTLLVRIPADAIDKLDGIDGVQRIDVPHQLQKEGRGPG